MGSVQVTLRIADLTIGVVGDSNQLEALNSERYDCFRCIETSPDLRITLKDSIYDVSDVLPPPEDKVFDTGTVWSLYESGNSISILLRSPGQGGLPYRLATFDRDLRNGEIVTIAGAGAAVGYTVYDPLEFPLSEVLTVCLMAQGRGLMVHACGISLDGRGILFPGNSTHGKTTIARLWKGSATILNDDRIILRRSGDRILMYGTPWHGDLSDVSAEGAELRSLYFLFHGNENRISRVTGAKAVSMLLKRSFLPLWSPAGMEFSLDFCSRLESTVTCNELSFVPDSSVIELIRCRD
jgi:hypothetical protein